MVTTLIPLTLYLAQAIGLYLILLGLSALVAPGRWRQVFDEFAASAALPLVTGIFAFVVGAMFIHIHSILRDPFAIIITAFGWVVLIKGALLIVVPHLLVRTGQWVLNYIRIWAALMLVFGILLALAGLTGTASIYNIVSLKGLPLHG